VEEIMMVVIVKDEGYFPSEIRIEKRVNGCTIVAAIKLSHDGTINLWE
jgi:hypothetical protein